MRNYLTKKEFYPSSAAWIFALSLCLIPGLATAQVAEPAPPNAPAITTPGVAGVANPATFSVTDRVGVAGTPALMPGANTTLGPGIFGVRDPASFSPVNRPALVGVGALSPGLTTISTPAVIGVRPALVDPMNRAGIAGRPFGGTGPGIAGPVNPATFSPSTEAGIATSAQLGVVSGTAGASVTQRDILAAPSNGPTLSNVDLSTRRGLVGRTSSGGASAALVITNRGGSVTTESRQ